MQLNTDKRSIKLTQRTKNIINIVNSVLRNQDLIASKLTHDILCLYSFTFYVFVDQPDDDLSRNVCR
jgi:hypothetical protein